jgi:putative restriction endonuclease
MSNIQIRRAAFAWLGEQVDVHGQVLSREVLGRGFPYKEERIPLVSPQGIFKPRQMELPLSITTVADSPYQDAFGPSLLRYRYRGTDPNHRDNAGLRELIRRREPLIYFHALVKGKYLAVWPVFVVGDEPTSLTFSVAVDDALALKAGVDISTVAEEAVADILRRYITPEIKRSIHQTEIR